MKYNLANMVKSRRPGTSAQVPVIAVPLGLERSILAQLRRIEHEVARGIREVIIPKYQQKLTTDADEASFDALRLLVGAMVRAASEQVSQLLKLEGRRHTKAWMSAARRAFGIDLSSVVKEEDLEDYLEQAALRNAALIRGMADDLLKRVAQETTTALIAGESAAQLQAKLKRQLEISDARARLIARDQTAKLTADLNRKRHEDAGIDSYIWRTSQDERVRTRHRDLEGRKYRYGEPTGAEEGLPPGQPIQCRCTAQAVVEFGEATTKPKPTARPAPLKLTSADEGNQSWVDASMGHLAQNAPTFLATHKALKTLKPLKPRNPNIGNAFYHPGEHAISMNTYRLDDQRGQEIWRHEFGHHIDVTRSGGVGLASTRAIPAMAEEGKAASKLVTEARRQRATLNAKLTSPAAMTSEFKVEGIDFDIKNWIKTHPTMSRSINDEEHWNRASQLLWAVKDREPHYLLAAYPDDHVLADFIGALTNNKKGYGHTKEYYKQFNKTWIVEIDGIGAGNSLEAFANYFALASAPDQTRINVIRHLFPKVSKHFDDIIKEVGE